VNAFVATEVQWWFRLRPRLVMPGWYIYEGAPMAAWTLRRLIISCRAVPVSRWEWVLLGLNRIWGVRWLFRSLIGIAVRRYAERMQAASRAAEVTCIYRTCRGRNEPIMSDRVPAAVFSELAIGTQLSAPPCEPGDTLSVTLYVPLGALFDVSALAARGSP
jgi:hypothetical protein